MVVQADGRKYEAQPVVVMYGPHVCVLEGAKEVWRESEGVTERLKGRGMGGWEAYVCVIYIIPTAMLGHR